MFSLIKEITPFTEANWAEFLNISTKTLERYKKDSQSFKPIHSEKLLRWLKLRMSARKFSAIWESLSLWLDTPNFALGKLKPLELLRDSYGKEMVIGELTHINHGILVLMEAFRLSREKFASTLSGKGAAIKGARWNSVGVEII